MPLAARRTSATDDIFNVQRPTFAASALRLGFAQRGAEFFEFAAVFREFSQKLRDWLFAAAIAQAHAEIIVEQLGFG